MNDTGHVVANTSAVDASRGSEAPGNPELDLILGVVADQPVGGPDPLQGLVRIERAQRSQRVAVTGIERDDDVVQAMPPFTTPASRPVLGVVGDTSTSRSVRRSARRVITRVLALVIVLACVVGLRYHDQIRRYVTHLKGSPTHTVAWTPFADDLPPELHLIAVGDIGYSSSRLRTTAAAIAELDAWQSADALALLGDNAYPSGDPVLLADTVFGPFGRLLDSGTELLAILGNHDVMDGNADGQVAALGMTGRWWARHDGDVLIVGLDSNLVADSAQLAWLEDVLSTATERWRIVLLHHPPYSAGYQGSNEAVRDAFTPLFERYGVQLVLSGHDHDYQRSNAINGVTYVVSGGAATTRRTGDADFTAVSFSWHHFVEVAVFPDRLVLRAVNQDLRVADEAIIQR